MDPTFAPRKGQYTFSCQTKNLTRFLGTEFYFADVLGKSKDTSLSELSGLHQKKKVFPQSIHQLIVREDRVSPSI